MANLNGNNVGSERRRSGDSTWSFGAGSCKSYTASESTPEAWSHLPSRRVDLAWPNSSTSSIPESPCHTKGKNVSSSSTLAGEDNFPRALGPKRPLRRRAAHPNLLSQSLRDIGYESPAGSSGSSLAAFAFEGFDGCHADPDNEPSEESEKLENSERASVGGSQNQDGNGPALGDVGGYGVASWIGRGWRPWRTSRSSSKSDERKKPERRFRRLVSRGLDKVKDILDRYKTKDAGLVEPDYELDDWSYAMPALPLARLDGTQSRLGYVTTYRGYQFRAPHTSYGTPPPIVSTPPRLGYRGSGSDMASALTWSPRTSRLSGLND
ncbi:hypothetical protein F4820DRAFT_278753 [Hypoxylon rubiginosum]|uniref:Uncharacterized protein n=1 Tax=Hypoxylon rubiginosum TaxID=110542 RepID=A0ACB9Z292_9PEZI|nr:hypothetical protein F4820DRAFT_278753 [Hypoxylon rubiginosum]